MKRIFITPLLIVLVSSFAFILTYCDRTVEITEECCQENIAANPDLMFVNEWVQLTDKKVAPLKDKIESLKQNSVVAFYDSVLIKNHIDGGKIFVVPVEAGNRFSYWMVFKYDHTIVDFFVDIRPDPEWISLNSITNPKSYFDTWTGSIIVKDVKGLILLHKTFENGIVIKTYSIDREKMSTEAVTLFKANSTQREIMGGLVGCINDAMQNRLPWYMKVVCYGGCASCLYAAQPYGCGACVGCLGGAAFHCAVLE